MLTTCKRSPPPFEKGGPGGFRRGGRVRIPPNPPLLKGGLNGYDHFCRSQDQSSTWCLVEKGWMIPWGFHFWSSVLLPGWYRTHA